MAFTERRTSSRQEYMGPVVSKLIQTSKSSDLSESFGLKFSLVFPESVALASFSFLCLPHESCGLCAFS